MITLWLLVLGADLCGLDCAFSLRFWSFILCGALAAFALGTQAASAAEFYIVRDASTKKCTVVDTKPMTTTTTVVGDTSREGTTMMG